MKISHRQNRLILRIINCLGAFFGILVFIYEAFIQRNILQTTSYICYLVVTGGILYLVFARRRPNKRFAYGTFFAMCLITILFLLSYIYQAVTFVPQVMSQLSSHIEQGEDTSSSSSVFIRTSRCCAISADKHTTENFQRFQKIYPEICTNVEFSAVKYCLPYIVAHRNLMIVFSCGMIIFRLVALFLLWKYIQNEYSGNNDELVNPLTAPEKSLVSTTTA